MRVNLKFIKKLSMDFIYSMLGIVIFNATIQLLVYPTVERSMGTAAFGNALTLLSVVSVVATSFGSAANYSRMLANAQHPTINGDYNRFLGVVSLLSIAVSIIALSLFDSLNVILVLTFPLLMIFSIFRYYADVPFRLKLNYKNYFLYYLAASVGYAAGAYLFKSAETWALAFAVGELTALAFACIKSDIFKRPWLDKSEYYRTNVKALTALSVSNLLSNLVLNADRFLIRLTIGAEMVTVFYVSTLIGKTISMVGTPLNSVLIGYLSKAKLNRRHIAIAALISVTVVVLGTLVCWVGSIIVIRFLYPSVYETARPFFLLGNLSQIFFFISNTLMVLVMCICGEDMSLKVSILHIVLFCVLVVPGGLIWGMWGIIIALAAVNMVKYLAILAIAWRRADKDEASV